MPLNFEAPGLRARSRRAAGWLNFRVIGAAVLTGAILHICTTLALARLTATRAYDDLAAKLPVNQMKILPQASYQAQVMPFQMPDMRYAICRYDASGGPVTVRATLPGPGWSFTIYTPAGDNIYVVTGQNDRRIDLALLLVPTGEEFVPLPREAMGRQSFVSVPVAAPAGLVVVRGPIPGRAYNSLVEAELAKAGCLPRK